MIVPFPLRGAVLSERLNLARPSTRLSGGLFANDTGSNPVSLFNRWPHGFRLRKRLKVPMVVFAGNVVGTKTDCIQAIRTN